MHAPAVAAAARRGCASRKRPAAYGRSLAGREDYEAAFALTDHKTDMGWTPAMVREVIKSYGDARSGQRVTLQGEPTDITQRKEVSRWSMNRLGYFGELWYDLNIDGF